MRINKNELMRGVLETPAAKPGDSVTVYSAEDIQIQQYGDAAVVAFKLIGTTTRSDGTKTVSRNLNTGTFIKRSGRWQAVAWQSTVIPETTTSQKAATTNSAAGGRKYILGPRGGCHYVSESGRKVYVDKSHCN